VTTIEGALRRWRETGCDGILIGRGAMANPWIFRQIAETLAGETPYEPTLADKRAVLLEYFELLRADMPEFAAIGRMKQLAGQFTRGLPGGARFRQVIYHSHSVTEVLDRIEEYFETVAAGRTYVGEGGEAEPEEAPALDSCEAATVEA
jgi:tRNA-dihydrouridine synthase